MTRLLGVLVTALLAWCGVMQPVQASVPTPAAAVATYVYDACHHAAVPTCTTTERGPPSEPYRDIANPAAGHRPDGALARSARTATSIAYTYDALAPLAQAARDAGTTHKQVQDERAALSALGESRVAAKLAPRQIDASWGGLIKYKHGGSMTAIEHINYRHAYTSGFSNVSKYSKGTSVRSIQGYVDDALRHGSVSADGTMVRHNVGRVIGTDQLGNPVTGIQVYVRNGQIQTAFPVAWP